MKKLAKWELEELREERIEKACEKLAITQTGKERLKTARGLFK